MKNIHFQYLIIAILYLSSITCSKDDITETYTYNPPEALYDGLEVSSLDSAGFDKELIEYMIDNINEYKYIHSILIVRNDKLVLEEYFAGYRSNTLNNTYSVTKSFCSALVGIAIDKQYINSVNDPIKTYLQEYNIEWTGKENITLHHLLTMSSGYKWDEDTAPYGSSGNSHTQMNQSPDQVKFVIERPVVAKPGTVYRYNSGTVNVLGKIVANSIDMEFDTFATRFLFKPLGIDRHKWYRYPSGIYHTGGNLEITSRDMVKFGLLYLNHGSWKGQQIISEEWINLSVKDYIRTNQSQVDYGYLWWKRPLLMLNGQRVEGYTAEGFGGQTIFVLPGYNMVVVFTSGIDWNEEELTYQPVEILEQFILPAIE